MITDQNYLPESQILKAAFPNILIKGELGEGGQKYVYLAKDETNRKIALKIIKTKQNPVRTLREISAAAQFIPPLFPEMFSWGQKSVGTDEIIFIIEEYIEGETLRKCLNRGCLPIDEVVRIGKKLINAIDEVADKRLVHRDVKPENILLSPCKRVVLLDFGIARHLDLTSLTQDMAIFGPMTAGYGAPEQIKNEKRGISTRTDLFSWAVVMYEMITGSNPFTQGCSTLSEVYSRTLSFNPPLILNCDLKLAELINWCLKKTSHQRPANPKIVLNCLGGF